VRILAATNQHLEAKVKAGSFREDLYYRLNVVPIVLPALAERSEDLPLLLDHFLTTVATRLKREPKILRPEAYRALSAHEWKGNVRELEHAIEHAAALTAGPVLLPEDLPPKLASSSPVAAGRSPLRLGDVVRDHLHRVLAQARWNKKLAAQLLGVHRRTLYRLAKRYHVSSGAPDVRRDSPPSETGEHTD
jgi:DNA-binding NtrC family response regulator